MLISLMLFTFIFLVYTDCHISVDCLSCDSSGARLVYWPQRCKVLHCYCSHRSLLNFADTTDLHPHKGPMRFEYFLLLGLKICFLWPVFFFRYFFLSFSVSSRKGKNRQKQVVTFCGLCLSLVIHRPFKGIILVYKIEEFLRSYCSLRFRFVELFLSLLHQYVAASEFPFWLLWIMVKE